MVQKHLEAKLTILNEKEKEIILRHTRGDVPGKLSDFAIPFRRS